jgi:putative YphP/YqiW family bacilliredoxin
MLYDPAMVQPMKTELTENGFEDLDSPEKVSDFFSGQDETQFLIINSVCGCAAGGARPGALRAMAKTSKKPSRIGTVFAGVDKEATQEARGKFTELPPSSPSMVFFKNGEVVHFIPRHLIEGRDPEIIADELVGVFEKNC